MAVQRVNAKTVDVLIAALLVSMLVAVYFVDFSSAPRGNPSQAGILTPAATSPGKAGRVSVAEVPVDVVEPPLATQVEEATRSALVDEAPEPRGIVDAEQRLVRASSNTNEIALPPESELPKQPAAPEVKFFQTRANAKSVAFVVDCSGSMSGERFDRARAELARSILDLRRDQMFYVVFYHDAFVPMYGNRKSGLKGASAAEKRRVIAWLNDVSADGGTNPNPALAFVAHMNPEVIYLLTDGQFGPLSSGLMADLARRQITVHTLGFGSDSDEANLQHIAASTKGTYRKVSSDDPASLLYLAPDDHIRSLLSSKIIEERRLAVQISIARELPYIDELIALLGDADTEIGSFVHDALVDLAVGSDFGPRETDIAAERSASTVRWRLWWKWRHHEHLWSAGLKSPDSNERWVATALARQSSAGDVDSLIELLDDELLQIRQEAHAALLHHSDGADFGPKDAADIPATKAAVEQWKNWRADELERIAEARRAEQEVEADRKLKLAEQLDKNNRKEQAQRRYAEIVRDFPDTKAADTAQKRIMPDTKEDES